MIVNSKLARSVCDVNRRNAGANFASGLGAIEMFFSPLEVFKLTAGAPCSLFDDLGSDARLGEHFQQKGVLHPAIDDMRFNYAFLERVEATVHLG